MGALLYDLMLSHVKINSNILKSEKLWKEGYVLFTKIKCENLYIFLPFGYEALLVFSVESVYLFIL